MLLLIVSFIAGALTVMAPCILPLLPVIIGGSIVAPGENRWRRPLTIAGSLAISVTIFTLLLKASTSLLGVPVSIWSTLSGIVIIILGLNLLFPTVWAKLATRFRFNIKANALLGKSYSKTGVGRDILVGAALGPVFSSCSPTYALIVAVVLPQSFAIGLSYLVAYSIGMAAVLLLISLVGQSLANRLAWLANPTGWFMKTIGLLFIVVGIAVAFGFDKRAQTYILDQGWYAPISQFELRLR